MEDFTWTSSDAAFAVPIAAAAICYCAYWFLAHGDRLKEWVETRQGSDYFYQYGALYQKGIGVVCLGILPGIAVVLLLNKSLTFYGLGEVSWDVTIYWILLFGGGLSFIPWYTARQKEMYQFYPQVRALRWDRRLLVINGTMWTLYLLAYEFLFRGIVLLSVASMLGWWPAITVTTALSTIAHIPKGAKETFGTIPFSVVLCLTVIQTGGIWACVVVHAILAISNDYWALHYHPQMQLVKEWGTQPAKKAAID